MTETSLEYRKKWIHCIGGALGWFAVNGLIWLLLQTQNTPAYASEANLFMNACIFPANLFLLIILIVIRPTRWIGQGILIAWGINFILALIFGAFINGVCLVPFYDIDLLAGW